MARKDISDREVVQAAQAFTKDNREPCVFVNERLHNETGEPLKVCQSAMSRASNRGYIDYGVSIRSAWPTEEGLQLINQNRGQ